MIVLRLLLIVDWVLWVFVTWHLSKWCPKWLLTSSCFAVVRVL